MFEHIFNTSCVKNMFKCLKVIKMLWQNHLFDPCFKIVQVAPTSAYIQHISKSFPRLMSTNEVQEFYAHPLA